MSIAARQYAGRPHLKLLVRKTSPVADQGTQPNYYDAFQLVPDVPAACTLPILRFTPLNAGALDSMEESCDGYFAAPYDITVSWILHYAVFVNR